MNKYVYSVVIQVLYMVMLCPIRRDACDDGRSLVPIVC